VPYVIVNGGFGPPAFRRLTDSTAGRQNRPTSGQSHPAACLLQKNQ